MLLLSHYRIEIGTEVNSSVPFFVSAGFDF